jgi:uncharacterized DUF497 family protein
VDFRDAIGIFRTKTVEWPDERFDYGEDRWIALGLNQEQEIFVV